MYLERNYNMEKQVLYHIHKIEGKDSAGKFWKENKEIKVDDKFKNGMLKRYNEFTTKMKASDVEGNIIDINIHEYLASVLFKLNSGRVFSKQELEEILKLSYHASYYGNMFKRETALENYRKDNVSTLPSRLHTIYLTDEKGVDYWINALQTNNYKLYRVEASGEIFKTNEQLIPDEELSYKDVYESAYNYWHPNFKHVPDYTNEYLVKGKVKVLEKIK